MLDERLILCPKKRNFSLVLSALVQQEKCDYCITGGGERGGGDQASVSGLKSDKNTNISGLKCPQKRGGAEPLL